MQVESLKLFCDVVRLRSFSRGAAENGVLQSAASQTVTGLERHLGIRLIDRSHRPFEMTPQGKLFYDGCREILHQYTDLETTVRGVQQDVNSVVHAAAIYSVGLADMSRHVQRFSQSHPQVRVQLEYLHPDRVYERVLEEAVDFGVVSYPQRRKELTVIPWREERMLVVVPPGHRLAKRRSIRINELASEKFVALDRDLVVRREIDRLFKRHGIEVDVTLEFDNIEAIKRAVEVGQGIAILPEPTLARETALGTLVVLEMEGETLLRPLGIIHRRGKKFYPNTQDFLELLLQNGRNGIHKMKKTKG